MFEFLKMMDNYESRKVGKYPDTDDWLVSTVAVSDSDQPYETAIKHPSYNEGEIIVVEMYDSLEDAKAGHERWIKTMTANQLPPAIKDVSSSEMAQLVDAVSNDAWRDRPYAEMN